MDLNSTGREQPLMDRPTRLRYLGNVFIIFGYFIMLWGDMASGLVIKIVAGCLLLPSLIKLKMWDAVVICSFFFIIELAKLLQIIVTERL